MKLEELSLHQIKNFIHEDTPPCISLFIPSSQISTEGVEPSNCYKRLLQQAHELLVQSYSPELTQRLLAPLTHLNPAQLLGEETGTLALFISPSLQGYKILRPVLAGKVVVANSFHIKPLLDLIYPLESFYVLSLQPKSACLYRGDSESLDKVHDFNLDTDLSAETMQPLTPPSLKLAQSLEKIVLKIGYQIKDLLGDSRQYEFYSSIDTQIRRFLKGRNVPLILAGTPSDCRRYRSINTCYQLRRGQLRQNITEGRTDSLELAHVGAKLLARSFYRDQEKKVLSKIERAHAESRLRVGINEVVQALRYHKVEALFVHKHALTWGSIDWSTGKIQRHPYQLNAQDDDLYDDCIERALFRGSTVIPLAGSRHYTDEPIMCIIAEAPPLTDSASALRWPKTNRKENFYSTMRVPKQVSK